MSENKYRNIVFYICNMGKFDSLFIMKNLSVYNQYIENPYTFESVNRDSDSIKLVVKRTIDNKVKRVVSHDSFAMLAYSLVYLCKAFDTDCQKSLFPYDLVTTKTLFYRGKIPSISYYNDTSHDDYKVLYTDNWDLKAETIKYLSNDLISLYEVLVEFSRELHGMFGLHMLDPLTISGLAMKLYLMKYYNKNNNPLPIIGDSTMFENTKKSYYGGRVEVFHPYGKNLYYYDVNSLYPYSSLNTLCGLGCEFVEFVDRPLEVDEVGLGFYYAKIDSNKANPFLGLLPKEWRKI